MRRDLPAQFESLRGKRCLVTGAAGFIGGALFDRLREYGLDVTGTVLFEREAQELRGKGATIELLDLSSDERWDAILANIDIVFHIAAMFQEVEKSDDEYDKVNHRAIVKLAEAATRMGVKRFIHCSTVGVHGDVKEIPATEETPFNPMDTYHETKLAGELALLEYARSLPDDGLVVTVNRPAMVYGPGDTRMLKMFKGILHKRFIMIGNGETLAHLGYIDDQVDSFLLGAVAPREDVHLQAINIASGEAITLKRMAQMIAVEGGVRMPKLNIPVALAWSIACLCEMIWKPTGKRPPLFRRRVGFFTHNRAFDLSKARRLLGYKSRVDAPEGIHETIEWYRREGLV